MDINEDKDRPYDHCGLAGSYAAPGVNVSNVVVEMGKAVQHRGQNGAGLAVKARGKMMKVYKQARAFNEVFSSLETIEENSLQGEIAVAHLRYPTAGKQRRNCDCGPFYAAKDGWGLSLAHNGSLVDIENLYKKLKTFGIDFESDSDSEILAWLIVTAPGATWKQKIGNALEDVKGAFSLVMVTDDDKLMALRDPWGVRPLVWSQDNGHVFVASETCALDRISIRHSEKLKAGQLLIADENGLELTQFKKPEKQSFCVFEKLYFSHETSTWDGPVGENRESLGSILAQEEIERIKSNKAEQEMMQKVDYVVAVPDTARPGAYAFYESLRGAPGVNPNLRYKRGLVKERYDYAKRTFIEDDPYLRNKHIEKKFFISPSIIGKSIYLVDDTAVRLNTFKILVEHLLNIGVKEIHCRFLAPKFLNPCFLGVNIGSRTELGAVREVDGKFKEKTEEEIRSQLKVSSVHYLTIGGMAKSLGLTTAELRNSHCTGCLDYNNPFDMHPYDAEYEQTTYIQAQKNNLTI